MHHKLLKFKAETEELNSQTQQDLEEKLQKSYQRVESDLYTKLAESTLQLQ